jgi:hypothetical protein
LNNTNKYINFWVIIDCKIHMSNKVQFQIWEIGYKQLFKWFNDIPQTTTKKK